MAEKGYSPCNPMRLYADGVFDLCHVGHARLLEQCKKKFPYVYLIIGVSAEEDVIKYKGKPLMNEAERGEGIRQYKWVDEVICPCPWVTTVEFLDEHNIDYICHDDLPYTMGADETGDTYSACKRAGRFLATQRTEGISTSDLIVRIIQSSNEIVQEIEIKYGFCYRNYKKQIKAGFNSFQQLIKTRN